MDVGSRPARSWRVDDLLPLVRVNDLSPWHRAPHAAVHGALPPSETEAPCGVLRLL